MAKTHYLAGVGRALIFRNNNLIGVAKTLQNSGINFSIAAEEIRGGEGNALWGKYFHDSNMTLTLTDAMFNLEYIAASLGVSVQSGGISMMEEEVVTPSLGGKVDLTETPIAFDGTMIGWYKKPVEDDWKIGNIEGKQMTIPGAKNKEKYCVKYVYRNENAESVVIPTQYVPAVLHVVVLNDLFAGDIVDQASTEQYGRLITDIPRLQMDGNQDLSLTADGAATVELTGSALAVTSKDSCTDNPYYGTMTQEVYGAKWQDRVVSIAVENADIQLEQSGTETLAVRVIYAGTAPAERKPNSAFTFAVEEEPAPTADGTAVGAHDGIVTAQTTNGKAVISVTLDGAPQVEPAYAVVTVTGGV